jgi:hypothetical protein
LIVPQQLFVVADDQEWCGLDATDTGDGEKRRGTE